MSPLSERVEAYLTGIENYTRFSIGRMFKEIFRGIRLTVRNLIRELLLSLVVLIVTGIFPLIAIFSGPAVFAIQSYYAGFGNMDFTLERHYGVKGSVAFVRNHKGLAVGNGIPFLLMLMIPVVGVFLAPGLSTVAATLETVPRIDTQPLPGVQLADEALLV
jgi:CysZ protein